MIRQIRSRLFLVSSVLLVLVGILTVTVFRERIAGSSLAEGLVVAVALGLATAALVAWVGGMQVRDDIRALMTTARRSADDARSDDDPDPLQVLVSGMADDAEKNRAALGRERALLASVLEGLSHGVIVFDARERIAVMNEPARRMLDLHATPIGEVLIDVVRSPPLIELVRRAPGEAIELPLRPDLRVVARVAAPHESNLRVVILEDITAVRRLETIRRDFVANVSHELRTPVSIIRANAETLLGGANADPAAAARLLDGLHRNAERLARMLADLLDLSRLDAAQFRFEHAEIPVHAAAEAALAALLARAQEREIAIHLEVDPAIVARADAKALDQVLVNLVDNAVKYGDKGGNVWVRATPALGRVVIDVCDDGPGIAPKHRERIFERFYRVDAGRAREAGGTGLGLAIVKHLVESMGGHVRVDANTPRGTRFRVELPAISAA